MYYFIVNPVSGRGKGKEIWKSVRKELERRNIPSKVHVLSYKGEARKIAASLSKQGRACTAVIIGGDGTINEFTDGLEDFADISVGIIPIGSANDFVLGAHLEKDPMRALEIILSGKSVQSLNVGVTRCRDASGTVSHKFVISSGIGFDAEVCDGSYEGPVKRFLNFFHLGRLIYMTTAVGLIAALKQFPMQIICEDGRELSYPRAFFAAAMNTAYEGGGFFFAPEADAARGSFELVVAENLTRRRAVVLLPLALAGRHVGKKGIHVIRGKKFTIRTGTPHCVHTDGEIPGYFKEVTFECLPQKLTLLG